MEKTEIIKPKFYLYRVKLRELVADSLRNQGLTNVFTAFNWPLDKYSLPAIFVTSPGDEGKSNGAGPPDFNRTAMIAIKVMMDGKTPNESQMRLDEYLAIIEHALMTDYELQKHISEVEFIKEENLLNSSEAEHFAEGRIQIGLAYQETWPLTEGNLITDFMGEIYEKKP